MGLDIYVGPLTRYYLGDWENVVQRYGREQGIPVRVIKPEGTPELPKLSAEQVLQAVTNWRADLSTGLGSNLSEPLDWPESGAGEYFTDRPAWDGYGSLALLAAYDEHRDLARPKVAIAKFGDDPAWKRSTAADFKSRYSSILLPELWLPCKFEFVFKAQDLSGNEIWMGSSLSLLRQLRELNNSTANATPAQLEQSRRENFNPGDSFDKASRFGLAMFLQLAEKSVNLSVPMKMDY